MLPKRLLRAHLVFGSRFEPETAPKGGGVIFWGPGMPLEPPWSPFAAGTLLDLDFGEPKTWFGALGTAPLVPHAALEPLRTPIPR